MEILVVGQNSFCNLFQLEPFEKTKPHCGWEPSLKRYSRRLVLTYSHIDESTLRRFFVGC